MGTTNSYDTVIWNDYIILVCLLFQLYVLDEQISHIDFSF